VIAGLQRLARDAVAAQLTAATPFHGPALHFTIFTLHFDVHKRVRISKQKLNQRPLDFLGFVLEVCRSERMMRECAPAEQHRNGRKRDGKK
jgi:hypothetical protein